MNTLQTTLRLITQDCFMASIDLKNAYYSVPIHSEHRKLFRLDSVGKDKYVSMIVSEWNCHGTLQIYSAFKTMVETKWVHFYFLS